MFGNLKAVEARENHNLVQLYWGWLNKQVPRHGGHILEECISFAIIEDVNYEEKL